jgi:hypothetical protein
MTLNVHTIRTSDRYAEFRVGSEGDDGEHLTDHRAGWPYSVYAKALEPGMTDYVICKGIQSKTDAYRIATMLNEGPVPA